MAQALLDDESPKDFFRTRALYRLPPGYSEKTREGSPKFTAVFKETQYAFGVEPDFYPNAQSWQYYKFSDSGNGLCFRGHAATRKEALLSGVAAHADWIKRGRINENEDPKHFFRTRRVGVEPLPLPDDASYDFDVEQDSDDPAGNFASGDDAQDAETLQWIRDELDSGNVWAWCCVRVTAKWTDRDDVEHEGFDSVGGCSYASERDFKRPGSYYDDMKHEAFRDLIGNIEHSRSKK